MVDIAQILPKMRLIALALGMLVCLGLLATAASRPASAQEQALKIVEKPPDLVLTVDRAVQVRQAINRGDFATAQKISDEVLSQSKMIFGGFYPFTAFIANVGQYNNKSFLGRLNAWATGDADAALPYLFRSLYYYQTGWLIRG